MVLSEARMPVELLVWLVVAAVLVGELRLLGVTVILLRRHVKRSVRPWREKRWRRVLA
jgi:hypothetical protein